MLYIECTVVVERTFYVDCTCRASVAVSKWNGSELYQERSPPTRQKSWHLLQKSHWRKHIRYRNHYRDLNEYNFWLLAYFPYFEKIKQAYEITSLSVCVCLCIPPIVARQRLRKNPPIVARKRVSRNVTAVTNIHATIEELLDASVSVWLVSSQGK
jgi:hypothetical protein